MLNFDLNEPLWYWKPSLFIYDTEACTQEEDDLANAVLYHCPRIPPSTLRTAFYGQVAGVIHFCRSAFSIPLMIHSKGAHVAIKDYGRFLLLVFGNSHKWSKSTINVIASVIDIAIGSLSQLWIECSEDTQAFQSRLALLLDNIIGDAVPELLCDLPGEATSSSTTSPVGLELSPMSDTWEDHEETAPLKHEEEIIGSPKICLLAEATKEKGSPDIQGQINFEPHSLSCLHNDLSAVPSVPLPKSDGGVFLRAQQLIEICKLQQGVLSGAILYNQRILASQIDSETAFVLTLINFTNKAFEILVNEKTNFSLPEGVTVHKLHMQANHVTRLKKMSPEAFVKRSDKKNLHGEASSLSLSSLRNAIQNRPLQTYPSLLPPLVNTTQPDHSPEAKPTLPENELKVPDKPVIPSAVLSLKNDLSGESRPSQSLPCSPRKIQISTMLPDVGSDSPDLRYKVLTSKRPKPLSSTHNTPRRMLPGGIRNGPSNKLPREPSGEFNNRISSLCAPSLKRNDCWIHIDKKFSPANALFDPLIQNGKENINDLDPNSILNGNDELNLKNVKNKLNLSFAPDKIYRPTEEDVLPNERLKEVNGNVGKNLDIISIENLNNHMGTESERVELVDCKDDDECSKSEESEISVLELSNYAETRQNGNYIFELATRNDSPRADISSSSDSSSKKETGIALNNGPASIAEYIPVSLLVIRHSNLALCLVIENAHIGNKAAIFNLVRMAGGKLPELNSSVAKALDLSEEKEGDTFIQNSNSILSGIELSSMNTKLLLQAHDSFSQNPSLTEITFREGECILWGHRSCRTETFYQSTGSHRPGLPISSGIMARIQYRARRRLERDYGITIM